MNGRAVTAQTTVVRGVENVVSWSAALNSGTAAAIIGEWKAPVDVELHRAQAELPGPVDRGRDLGAGARQDDLQRRVVVGHGELRRLGDVGGVLGGAGAEHRDHRAVAGGAGGVRVRAGGQARLVHEPAAQRDELQALALVQGAGGDERAQLAERVPGHHLPERGAERRPAREAGAEDRRLGVVGAVVDAREGVLADDLGGERQQVGADARDEVAHLARLAPLTGEQDRAGGAVDSMVIQGERTPKRRVRYGGIGSFPPIGGTWFSHGLIRGSCARDPRCRLTRTAVSLPVPTPRTAALVTGASAGIGTEIARELARRGHALILVARRKGRLDELAAELTAEYSVRAETLGCDLSKPTSRRRLPARVATLGLEVDVLANNAGFATGRTLPPVRPPSASSSRWRVLVEAPVALCSAFVPGMVRRGSGAVLNVASTAGMQPLPTRRATRRPKPTCSRSQRPLHHELRGSGVTGR